MKKSDMDRVDKLMQTGIRRRIFPGAALQVVAKGKTVFKQAYGAADLFSGQQMTVDTCFDLASLTKPLATVMATMVLVEQGKLALEQTVGELCPPFAKSHKAGITVRQLLTHSSGLPPWRPFFMSLRRVPRPLRHKALRALLLAEPLICKVGEKSEYSDLGFMVLQWVIETVSGQTLDRFVTDAVYAPLDIGDLFYKDAFSKAGVESHSFAATQLCPWRHRLMIGTVDDDNAYVTGGVAGHAGLFGTVSAVSRLLQELLAVDQGDTSAGVFHPDLVHTFFTAPENQRWALGFDTPSPQGSSAGQYFSPLSIGHLGFTGTSFWVDRPKAVIVVLLTNRVHPWRFNVGIKAFRPKLHDAVMEAV